MTGSLLVSIPVVAPLLGAGIAVLVRPHQWLRRIVGVTTLAIVLATSAFLLAYVDSHGPIAVPLGGWGAQLGIALVVDRLAALLLLVSSAVLFFVLCYAIGQRARRISEPEPATFLPTYLTLAAGVCLAFASGDLFNLFVAFEVMLASSYVLIMLPPDAERVRAGTTYVVVSLTSSLLFLTAVGLLYAVTGTVNMALMAQRVDDVPAGLATALGMVLVVAFGIKAAIVPLHFWLPDSYPTALSMVTAVFAALLTKVAVYALIRTQTLLFPSDEVSWPLLAFALATMLVGTLCALGQDDLNRMLSFLLVGHIGYLVFGLALFSVTGLRGSVLYLAHHILVQATLFQASGLVQDDTGTVSLRASGGVVHRSPAVGVAFFVGAIALVGVPPLSGFVAKLALLQAGIDSGHPGGYLVAAGIIATSVLGLAAIARAWVLMFWGDPHTASARAPVERTRGARGLMLAACWAALAGSLAITAFAGPLSDYAQRSADDLMTYDGYLRAVLETEGTE